MRIKIFLTFDHELPLGGITSSWDDAIFNPTQKVMDIANDQAVPITLFTDVLCAIRFAELGIDEFVGNYEKQLLAAMAGKHDVQLHLHPHWLSSTVKGTRFVTSTDFSFNNFVNFKGNSSIESIIERGVKYLHDLLQKANHDYKCIAYRAGGYNLGDSQAYSRIIKALSDFGILYDSSICKGYFFSSGISKVDYRKTPSAPNWYLSYLNHYDSSSLSNILEVPIAGIPKSIFEVPTFLKMKKMASRAPANRGFQIHEGNPGTFINRIKMFTSSRMLGFDNYTYSHEYLMKILDYNVKQYKDHEEVLLSVVGHPKSMGEYSLEMMKRFIGNARMKYSDLVFTTFSAESNQHTPC